MAKTFLAYFENDEVDGQQIMKALRKIKGYHHVQDITSVGWPSGEVCTCEHPKSKHQFFEDHDECGLCDCGEYTERPVDDEMRELENAVIFDSNKFEEQT